MTDAYKMQVLDDHNGRRLRVDGPHQLHMFRPESAAEAPPILQSGHICWVRPDEMGAVAAALELSAELPEPEVFIVEETWAL